MVEKICDMAQAFWEKGKGYVLGIKANWVEGRKPRAIAKVAIPLVILVAVIGLVLLLWKIRVVIGLLLFAAFAIYCFSVAEKGGQHTAVECSEAPDLDDYENVEVTLRYAAKKVQQSRYFGRIYEETDIRANDDEMITAKGDFFRFKYRLPGVDDTSKNVDPKRVQEVLQKEVLNVLKGKNPANMAPSTLVHNGVTDCIIQIDEVELSDDYVYVFCVLATDEYFAQRQEQKSQQKKPAPPIPQDPLFKK